MSTLRLELEQEFSVQIPEVNQNKLFGAILLTQSDSFYVRPYEFITVTNALADNSPNSVTVFNLATVPEMAWAVTEAMIIAPPLRPQPGPGKHMFSEDIRGYAKIILEETGFQVVPKSLAPLEIELDLNASAGVLEDPEFFAAVYSIHKDRADSIDRTVAALGQELMAQISTLPMRSLSPKAVADLPNKIIKRLSN